MELCRRDAVDPCADILGPPGGDAGAEFDRLGLNPHLNPVPEMGAGHRDKALHVADAQETGVGEVVGVHGKSFLR